MTPEQSEQRLDTAARIVGASYLATTVTCGFAMYYVRGALIVASDAAATARKIAASENLFRAGLLAELATWAGVVVLTLALYELTRAVDKPLARLAAAFRLLEAAIMSVTSLSGFVVLLLLSDAPYLRAVPAAELQALARVALSAHAAGFNVGLLFFGIGSTLFAYLLYRSRLLPRLLAALGVFGSALVVVSSATFVLWPSFVGAISPACYGPIFLFEVTVGLWLLVRGVRGRASVTLD